MDFYLYALADGELQVLLYEYKRRHGGARLTRAMNKIDRRLAFLFDCWAASAEAA